MYIFSKVLNNQFFLSLTKKIFVIVCGVITTALLTRYLGPEGKGLYASILSVLTISETVFNIGINQSYPFFKRKQGEQTGSIFLSLSIILFIFYLVLASTLTIFTTNPIVIFLYFLSTIGVLRIQMIQYTLVETFKQHSLITIVGALFNVISILVIVLFFDSSIYLALLAYIAKDILIVILSFMSLRGRFQFTIKFMPMWKKIIKFGISPMLITLLVSLNYQIDFIMLNMFNVDLVLVGYYSVGVSLAQYGWLIPDIFKDVLINRTSTGDNLASVNLSLRLSSTLLILFYIFLAIFGRHIMLILFGSEFIDGYPVTIVIFIGIYFMLFTKLIGTLYIAQGKLKFYLVVLSLAVLSNVVSNSIFIPIFDIYGAAYSTIISYAVAGLFFLLHYKFRYLLKYSELLFINKNDFSKLKSIVSRR